MWRGVFSIGWCWMDNDSLVFASHVQNPNALNPVPGSLSCADVGVIPVTSAWTARDLVALPDAMTAGSMIAATMIVVTTIAVLTIVAMTTGDSTTAEGGIASKTAALTADHVARAALLAAALRTTGVTVDAQTPATVTVAGVTVMIATRHPGAPAEVVAAASHLAVLDLRVRHDRLHLATAPLPGTRFCLVNLVEKS